jgi:hypothetical protein
MTTSRQNDWKGAWTAEEPAAIGFTWAANEDGEYLARGEDGLLYRDLGLAAASEGALGVSRIKVGDAPAASRARRLDADFDFLFVLSGSVAIEDEDGESVTLRSRGAALHPANHRYRLSAFSEDFEAVHVTAPAIYGLELTDAAPLSRGDRPLDGAVYTHDTDDEYVRGDGPRKYFLYRDLRTREPSAGRIHIHVVRATEAGPGTGWHYHTMAQWFMVIGGSAVICVETRAKQPLGWGDSMCVGRGPNMRHNVTSFSGDYLVLEMCIPAEYDTVGVDEPDGADDA